MNENSINNEIVVDEALELDDALLEAVCGGLWANVEIPESQAPVASRFRL